jgi:ATP-binding cassette, subfamily B, bacterial
MNMLWRLSQYGRRHKAAMGSLIALSSAGILFELLKPWPLKLIVDNVVKGHPLPESIATVLNTIRATSPHGLLILLAAMSVLIFALTWVLGVVQAYVQTRVGTAMVYDVAGDLFRRLHRLSLPFHVRSKTGDLVKRVTSDCACARDLFINVLLPTFTSVFTVLGMMAILWRLDHALALVSFAAIPLLAICIWFFSKSMAERTYEQYSAQGEVTGFANELFPLIPMTRVFGRERYERDQFETLATKADAAGLRATKAQLRFKLAITAITSTGAAGVIALGGFHVIDGKLTLGSLLVFLTYLQSLYGPLETVAYLSSGWAAANAGARRVYEVLDSTEVVPEAKHPTALPKHYEAGAEVKLENVTFGYVPGKPVLHDVSFTVRPGETVALIGPSGAGKSALISLIPRLFDPWRGRVLINGVDVRELRLPDLRKEISVVLQDDFILPLTVAQNIAYGKPDATRTEIEQAARAAQADGFILRLPNGYDTVLAERGRSLSGGERQRISIARALLKAAPILVMDEPTSALDSKTEAGLLARLSEFSPARTQIIIAHRLSTIRSADRIFVLEHGRIVEAGSHRDLIQMPGAYARLSRLQSSNRKTSTVAIA